VSTGPTFRLPDPRDRLGRKTLHRLSPWTLLAVAATAGVSFKVVPHEYWRAVSDVASHEQRALIDCPCGSATEVALADLAECACGRWFFYAGSAVLAYLSPA
jgi:hypothetical protein